MPTSDIFNVILINNRDKYYEYTVNQTEDALDMYIKNELGFEQRFSATEAFWNGVKESVNTIKDKINLVNGFCNRDRNRIKKIYTECLPVYPLFVRFVSNNGFRVFSTDTYEELTELSVQFGDSTSLYIVADRGYKVSEVSCKMYNNVGTVSSIGTYDEKYGIITLENITGQVLINVSVQSIEGDWQIIRDIDQNLNSKNSQTTLKAGDDYYDVIAPISKQYIPEVFVYKNGTDITNSVYTFDIEQWCGIINFNADTIAGHIYIKACANKITETNLPEEALDKYTYDLSICGPDSCEVEFIDNITGTSHKYNPSEYNEAQSALIIPKFLNCWTELNATIIIPDVEYKYEISTITVTMGSTDITTKCKININPAYKNRAFLYTDNILGNITINVAVKPL